MKLLLTSAGIKNASIHDALLDLFKGDAVGRGVVLDPATIEDMCGQTIVDRPSLEVIYEGA